MSETFHIVCPHCHAINRVPKQRLSEQPNCGRCPKLLFSQQPLDLTQATFDKHITRNDVPVLVDFWAPWCQPCLMMAPQFTQAAARLEPYVRLAKVNTEAEQALGARFGIRSIPTLSLFHQGKIVAQEAGAMSAADILRWTQQHHPFLTQ